MEADLDLMLPSENLRILWGDFPLARDGSLVLVRGLGRMSGLPERLEAEVLRSRSDLTFLTTSGVRVAGRGGKSSSSSLGVSWLFLCTVLLLLFFCCSLNIIGAVLWLVTLVTVGLEDCCCVGR